MGNVNDAKEAIRAGNLKAAREQLTGILKKSPGDIAARTILFQVLLFYGEWEKAGRQCDIIAAQDEKAMFGTAAYKSLLDAEKERAEVASLSRRPSFLPKAPPYFETYAAAIKALSDGDMDAAGGFFDDIQKDQPVAAGRINDKPFIGIRDTDACLSGFLEAMAHERYVWIPFEQIRELAVPEPQSLFDLIWAPCRITLWEGLTLNCFLPVLYPNSFSAEDDRIKMGRMTDWETLGGPYYRGMGQHVYDIGGEDVSLLEIREVVFSHTDTTTETEAGENE